MKFYIHKLGCPKNDVDADYIAARLIKEGHAPVDTPEEADSVIVNTCGFILPAKEESIEEILKLGQLKKSGQIKKLYASGCLSQKYGDDLLKGMPELDGTFGLGALDQIAESIGGKAGARITKKTESRHLTYLSGETRYLGDNLPYAYLKISDGCDRACTYCSIPSIRGRFRSRPLDDILKEAEFLAQNGKRELILVSQEATVYGSDLPRKSCIVELLRKLDEIDGIRWIRPMYLHPALVTDDLIAHMLDSNKTLSYFDLPLQHINDTLLKAMRREPGRMGIEKLIGKIRSGSNEVVIRTVFIVGFPGESDDHFSELLQFAEKHEFDRLGAFVYSREEGTPADRMANHVPEKTAAARLDKIMSLQREIAFDKNISLIGSAKEVIIDSPVSATQAIGRTWADCPDIDQEIEVTGTGLEIGDIVTVRIDMADGYDLKGTVVGSKQ